MTNREREVAARVVKLGVGAFLGGWKRAAGDSIVQFVDAWAGAQTASAQRLQTDVYTWARNPKVNIPETVVDLAFKEMEGVLKDYGASITRVVELSRNPERIADEVFTAAEFRFAEKGSEARTVGKQIAVMFYRNLISDPDMADLLDHATNQQTYEHLMREKTARMIAERDARSRLREGLTNYLTTLIKDLSRDPWPRDNDERVLTITDLERTLHVTTEDPGVGTRPADEVADASQHLVILGDAGSGKTWLARRIARRAAHTALDALHKDAQIEDVEVPLLVTCDQFRNVPGSARDAAVTPAVDSRSDFGAGLPDPLKAHLRARDGNVLLVLDSLDEATTGSRDIDQALIGTWRTVLTTRPHAWKDQWTKLVAASRLLTTATLQPLSPDDVTAFILAWHSPTRETIPAAEHLLSQLDGNRAARELATVPLFLTFLCLVAPDGDLPQTRSALMDQVLNRLITASWRRTDTDTDYQVLLDTLRSWAWRAARNHPVNGLSDWPDTFTTNDAADRLTQWQRDRLDAVTPVVKATGQGVLRITERRFIHRALREHLVAQTVAALPLDDALDHLLAHWWFDETWQNILPTAIAHHPGRNDLLRQLVQVTAPLHQLEGSWTQETIRAELRICIESTPADWDIGNQAYLNKVRASSAASEPLLVARTGAWPRREVVTALTTYLPSAGHRTAEVVRALVELDPSEATRTQAVTALTASLPTAGHHRTAEVVRALVELATSEATRTQAVTALTASLPTAGHRTAEVVRALVELDPSEATRTQAVTALTAYLPTADYRTAEVVRALVELATSEATRTQAVTALTAYLPTADYRTAEVARALVELATSEATRTQAVTALTAYLPTADYRTAEVARALVELATSEATRTQAVTALTTYLPTAGHRTAEVVRALVELDPSEATRTQAVTALTTYLPTAGHRTAEVARALVELDPSEATRTQAVTALTAHLPTAGHRTREVARALVELDPSEATRTQAVTALTAHLPTADYRTREVARALVELDPSEATRTQAVTALTAHLPTAGHRTEDVARALVELDPSEATRTQAVTALTASLPTAGLLTARVLRTLVELATSEATRTQAVTALTAHLPSAGVWTEEVVRALVELATSEATRTQAVTALTTYLPTAGYRTAEVVRALVELDPSEATRTQAVTALTASLPTAGHHRTAEVVRALVELATSEATRTQAVTALTTSLPTAGHRTAEVARALIELDPSEATRTQAVTALTASLPTAGHRTAEVARTLIELDPSEATRTEAVSALLRFDGGVASLGTSAVTAVRYLSSSGEWQRLKSTPE